MRRTLTSAGAVLLLLTLVVGVPASAATANVDIRENVFTPQEVRVEVGDTVTWTHVGVLSHDVTSDDGLFASGDLRRGGTFSHTFAKAGTYYYHCSFHGDAGKKGMWGVVIVGDPKPAEPAPGRPRIDVPGDFASIQAAVDAADSGSTIVVAPGRYGGGVTIEKDDLVVRGVDRYRTVLHGEDERDTGILVRGAADVTIANLTVRNFVTDGIAFVDSYRYTAKGIDAIENRMHGISARGSYEGVVRTSFGWGSGAAAFHVAGCMGCGTLLEDLQARASHAGIAALDVTGVTIRGSSAVGNGVGIALLSTDGGTTSPGRGALLTGNIVRGQGGPALPPPRSGETFGVPRGTGVWLAGVENTVVRDNGFFDHARYGILLSATAEGHVPARNTVQGNSIDGAELGAIAWDGAGRDNCFDRNTFAEPAAPPDIEKYTCDKRPFAGEPYAPVQDEVAEALPASLAMATAEPPEPRRPSCQKGKPGCHRH